jgi:hypothetical protein
MMPALFKLETLPRIPQSDSRKGAVMVMVLERSAMVVVELVKE